MNSVIKDNPAHPHADYYRWLLSRPAGERVYMKDYTRETGRNPKEEYLQNYFHRGNHDIPVEDITDLPPDNRQRRDSTGEMEEE